MSNRFITINTITKTYENNAALDNINLTLEKGAIVSLLGPSGCGKTTLLRIIAGLETSDTGEILIEGSSVIDLPPEAREFGLMFQDLVLFPHLNVSENISFGLEMQGLSRKQAKSRVDELLSLVNLPQLAKRKVQDLSGGERQRIALARALAPAPKLLMLDEPMGALDSQLRQTLYIQIRDILKSSGITAIYVTHDRNEAFAVSDYSVIMNHGRIIQTGTPYEIYSKPKTTFVAQFMGFQNLVKVGLAQGSPSIFTTPFGLITIPPEHNYLSPGVLEGTLIIPESSISFTPSNATSDSAFEGVVSRKFFQDGGYRIQMSIEDTILHFVADLDFNYLPEIGDPTKIAIDWSTALVVPHD
jgi:ABC-type Fe3+/spermidine/putrescine transport system ATPase subunit